MTTSSITPHEALELHEILAGEVTAAQKMLANLKAVHDNDIRSFMEEAITARQRRANQIQQLLTQGTLQ